MTIKVVVGRENVRGERGLGLKGYKSEDSLINQLKM